MKITLPFLSLLALPVSSAFADSLSDYLSDAPSPPTIIVPQYYDLFPGDGIFDAGSPTNPIIIQQGQAQYRLRSQMLDLTPGDSIFDAGTIFNPLIID